jgi:hypothetical protein
LKELNYIKEGRGEEKFSKVCWNDILNFFHYNLF